MAQEEGGYERRYQRDSGRFLVHLRVLSHEAENLRACEPLVVGLAIFSIGRKVESKESYMVRFASCGLSKFSLSAEDLIELVAFLLGARVLPIGAVRVRESGLQLLL